MLGTHSVRNALHHPLFVPFYFPSLLYSFAQGLLVPVLPLFAAGFDVSYGLIGLVLAAEGLGNLLGDLPAGMLMRRLGMKQSMVLGLGVAGLTTVTLFWAGSIPQVLVLRLLAGLGGASYHVARLAYVSGATENGNRGRALAAFGGIFRMGNLAGPAIGGSIAAAFGLRAPFLVVGAACATGIIALVRSLPGREVEPRPASQGSRSQRTHILGVVKTHFRVLLAAGTGQMFAQMVRSGRTVIIPLYGAGEIGLDAQAIGLIISIAALVELTMFYPTGIIMDQLGRKFAIVPCFFIQAIGLALIPLTASFGGLLLATTLTGIGNGLGSGTMMTLGADLAPYDARGEFLGVWNLIGDLGSGTGPLVAGAVADVFALPAAALVLAGAGFLAAAVFALAVPETLRRSRAIRGVS